MTAPFETVQNLWSAWLRDEEGASLVEYVLLVALIAVVCIVAVAALGSGAKATFEKTASQLPTSS